MAADAVPGDIFVGLITNPGAILFYHTVFMLFLYRGIVAGGIERELSAGPWF